ncbi:MAG: substrate-binding domain-containing protein, partial [Pollutimonas bauzanensis]
GLITTVSQPCPSPIRDREAGYTAELLRRGIRMDEDAIVRVAHFSYQTGFEAAQTLLERNNPDSIFCVNDIIAIGALDGARALDAAIPGDLWVVGYDDIPMCAWRSIGLTTVRVPIEAMVDAAVGRLCERLESNSIPARNILLPNEIVFRNSSGQ